jgi:RimJ/RimL family protein N-acetyltransferase
MMSWSARSHRMIDDPPRKRLSVSMDHFTTNRLAAARLCEDHLDDLVALHLDPDVSRYLGGVRSAEVTKTYLATNMTHWDRHGFGLWALRTKDGAFAGRAGIRHILVDGI